MVRKYVILMCLCSTLFSIDIRKLDVAVEIGDSSNYSFFDGAPGAGVIRIPFINTYDTENYDVEIGRLNGSFSSGNDTVSYKAAKNPMLDDISGKFPLRFTRENSEKEVPFIIHFSGEKILAPGTYTAEIPIRISKGEDVVLEKTVTAFFNVQEQLEARLFLDGDMYDEEYVKVAFGEVETSAEKELFLAVRANTDVRITVTSQNNGRLILDGEGDKFTPHYIPYTLQCKGEEISLTTKTTVLNKKFNPNTKEIYTPMKLLLNPDLKKNFSGKYRDRICITITPP